MTSNDIKITPLMDSLRLSKISDQVYFSEKYSGYISNSRLGLLNPNKGGNASKFFAGLGQNKIYSPSLLIGSAVHGLVLQPESFKMIETVDRTTAKLGFVHDLLYKHFVKGTINNNTVKAACVEVDYQRGNPSQNVINNIIESGRKYWTDRFNFETHYDEDKEPIILDPKSREVVKECVKALHSNKEIRDLLHPEGILQNPVSENEQTILLDVMVEVTGCDPFIFKLKAKLDNYTIDTELNQICVNDIKTIGSILSNFDSIPDGNFFKYSYYRELAMYSWLLGLVATKFYGLSNPTITSNCLVVSTIPQYYTKVYKVKKNDFLMGWNEFKYLLKLAAYYYSKGFRFE